MKGGSVLRPYVWMQLFTLTFLNSHMTAAELSILQRPVYCSEQVLVTLPCDPLETQFCPFQITPKGIDWVLASRDDRWIPQKLGLPDGVTDRAGPYFYLHVTNQRATMGSNAFISGRLPEGITAVCVEVRFATTGQERQTIRIFGHLEGDPFPPHTHTLKNSLMGQWKDINTGGQWKTVRVSSCVPEGSFIVLESEKSQESGTVAIDYIKVTGATMDCPPKAFNSRARRQAGDVFKPSYTVVNLSSPTPSVQPPESWQWSMETQIPFSQRASVIQTSDLMLMSDFVFSYNVPISLRYPPMAITSSNYTQTSELPYKSDFFSPVHLSKLLPAETSQIINPYVTSALYPTTSSFPNTPGISSLNFNFISMETFASSYPRSTFEFALKPSQTYTQNQFQISVNHPSFDFIEGISSLNPSPELTSSQNFDPRHSKGYGSYYTHSVSFNVFASSQNFSPSNSEKYDSYSFTPSGGFDPRHSYRYDSYNTHGLPVNAFTSSGASGPHHSERYDSYNTHGLPVNAFISTVSFDPRHSERYDSYFTNSIPVTAFIPSQKFVPSNSDRYDSHNTHGLPVNTFTSSQNFALSNSDRYDSYNTHSYHVNIFTSIQNFDSRHSERYDSYNTYSVPFNTFTPTQSLDPRHSERYDSYYTQSVPLNPSPSEHFELTSSQSLDPRHSERYDSYYTHSVPVNTFTPSQNFAPSNSERYDSYNTHNILANSLSFSLSGEPFSFEPSSTVATASSFSDSTEFSSVLANPAWSSSDTLFSSSKLAPSLNPSSTDKTISVSVESSSTLTTAPSFSDSTVFSSVLANPAWSSSDTLFSSSKLAPSLNPSSADKTISVSVESSSTLTTASSFSDSTVFSSVLANPAWSSSDTLYSSSTLAPSLHSSDYSSTDKTISVYAESSSTLTTASPLSDSTRMSVQTLPAGRTRGKRPMKNSKISFFEYLDKIRGEKIKSPVMINFLVDVHDNDIEVDVNQFFS